ncbi:MAG: nitroreductase, partial [Oscillospiraceae bacterium]|nr:nitroreductase [Oscillospiraceae bacterium]
AKLRRSVRGDDRLSPGELFFEGDFSTPLGDGEALELLEAVRWAPSAANKQPCRVVKVGNKYHFYKKHTKGYTANEAWDVQKIDVGIALCHFMSVTGGSLELTDFGIACGGGMEYIATVRV